MKIRKLIVSSIILLSILLLLILHNTLQHNLTLFMENDGSLSVLIDEETIITSFEKEDATYFFLPSYVNMNTVKMDEEGDTEFYINGVRTKHLQIVWNTPVTIMVKREEETIQEEKSMIFMKSANLHTMFFDLEEGELESINHDTYVFTDVKVYDEVGNQQFAGESERIKTHGNTTLQHDKKPYILKLQEKEALCGMGAGKNWILLANAREGTKIANKLILDMADAVGLGYTSEAAWTDVYINGEYRGNYLLCQKIDVASNSVDIYDLDKQNKSGNDVDNADTFADDMEKGYLLGEEPRDITGGYLLEKDLPDYYGAETCGFTTQQGMTFTITSPKKASQEEVGYISDYIQNIETLIANGDDVCFDYIDQNSFTKRFLIEEMSFNYDTGITSYYFYKKADDDTLYAGPMWDFDNIFGEANSIYVEYEVSELDERDYHDSGEGVLNWDADLYNKFPQYKEKMISTYKDTILPYIHYLLEEGIDDYADIIRDSVAMDMIKYDYGENEAGHYQSFENNIRYTKYFLGNRMNFLNDRWNIEDEPYRFQSIDTVHTVYFMYEDHTVEYHVPDGQTLTDEELPEYDTELYSGWKYARDHFFSHDKLPILEDTILYQNARG